MTEHKENNPFSLGTEIPKGYEVKSVSTSPSPESKGMEEWESELKETAIIIKEWIITARESKEPYFEIPHKKFADLFTKVATSSRQSADQRVAEAVRGENNRVIREVRGLMRVSRTKWEAMEEMLSDLSTKIKE